MHRTMGGVITGNVRPKYRSKNPLEQLLVANFVRSASSLLSRISFNKVLDAGCGDGELGHLLVPQDCDYTGVDLDIEGATKIDPKRNFLQEDLTQLPFSDESFDLVMACEVLEHVPDPDAVLQELHRVCNTHLLLSVPWEPMWRVMNVARGAYLLEGGNTPGHLQHFSRAALRESVTKHGFLILEERHPFPWTMVLAKKVS